MKPWAWLLVAIFLVVVGLGTWAGWMVRFRPLEVWTWTTRLALARGGLTRATVDSPAGPQVVWRGGSGPILVLLHGAGDNAGTWFRVVPALVRTHRLVIPDLAGHGGSAPESGPIAVPMILDGVEAVLTQQSEGQRVALVGNSLGAWIAMLVARRHPDWVERLVLIDGGALKGSNEYARILPHSRREAREAVAQTRDPGSPPVPGFVLDDIVRQARVGPLARLAATASTMEGWVLNEEQLRDIQTPVQLIWGTSDRLLPLDYARRMLNALPHAGLFTIERCGHVPQVECPGLLLGAFKMTLDQAIALPGTDQEAMR